MCGEHTHRLELRYPGGLEIPSKNLWGVVAAFAPANVRAPRALRGSCGENGSNEMLLFVVVFHAFVGFVRSSVVRCFACSFNAPARAKGAVVCAHARARALGSVGGLAPPARMVKRGRLVFEESGRIIRVAKMNKHLRCGVCVTNYTVRVSKRKDGREQPGTDLKPKVHTRRKRSDLRVTVSFGGGRQRHFYLHRLAGFAFANGPGLTWSEFQQTERNEEGKVEFKWHVDHIGGDPTRILHGKLEVVTREENERRERARRAR